MNTEFDPIKIKQLLDHGTRQMSGQVLLSLSRARQKALERQAVHVPDLTLASNGAGPSHGWMHWVMPQSIQQMVIAGLLASVVVSGVSYWHHAEEQRIGELDVAILTDELPIEVFVDH